MKKPHIWYVEPLDSKSNRIIANALLERIEESELCGVLTADNKRHNLWRCSFDFASCLWKSRGDLGITFRIYSQYPGGRIRECTFIFGKRKPKKALAK